MKTQAALFLLWALSGTLSLARAAEPHDLTLPEIMRSAAEASPSVAAARLRNVAAERRISVERASYFPQVNLEAVESTGFAGSVGHLGIAGMVGSPYRSGAAAGIVANVPLWDFGRTSNAVTVARHHAESEAEQTNYRRYQIYQSALHLYYRCALNRDSKVWGRTSEHAALVRNEVTRFVRTGQRSIVERYLSESQQKEAETQTAIAEEDLGEQQKEIALLTNLPLGFFVCPTLPEIEGAVSFFHGTPQGNPVIAVAEASLAAARAKVAQSKSDFLPKVVGVADLGAMQETRLVPRNFYAVGVALILPVFEGFKTTNEVKEAEALQSSQEKELESKRLEIADLNAQYDKAIKGSGVALSRLKEEKILAERGFDTAKQRYFSLQGSVVDVREALRNLSRTEVDYLNAKASYLEALGAKAVLNGTPF